MSRRNKRNKKKDYLGAGLLLLSATIIVLFGMAYFNLYVNKVPVDDVTHCPERGPDRVIAVLIDLTELNSRLIKDQISGHVESIKNESKKHERIDVYVMEPNSDAYVRQLMSVCNPGKKVNKYIENVKKAKIVWKESFSDVLDRVRDVVASSNKEDKQSAIMESIKAVAINSMLGLKSETEKSVIIFSDMIQNVTEYSQYRERDYNKYFLTPYGNSSLANLSGASVKIFYIDRPRYSKIQSAEHIKFWRKWINESNGNLNHVVRLR